MLIGFLISRAMLSITVILFGVNALFDVHPRKWFAHRWWLLGTLWVIMYFISGFWSNDIDYWMTRCEVKLPILLLPLAFAFISPFSYTQRKIITLTLNTVVFAGMIYSLSFLFINPEFYIHRYNFSNVLPTLPKGDHIVFSLTMALTVVWNIQFHKSINELWLKRLNIMLICLFIAMIHVLSVRTGLVALYLFVFAWSVYLLFQKKTRIAGLALLLLLSAGAWIALNYVPTIRNRLAHTNYTFQIFRQGVMSGDYSDIGRYMSYDVALRLIKERPLMGVGAGDMLDSMKGGYDRWYPHVPDEQRLIPHNQYLTVALGMGLPCLLVFIAWSVYPLFTIRKNRNGFFLFVTWAMMMVPLMFEPFLEIQFGVFVYLFFMLWQQQSVLPHESD